jgi:Protein of unknown function (DUF3107)
VDVRIGVTQSVKEIELELADADRDATVAAIAAQIASGEGTLSLTDKKGRTVLIPAAKVAYVDLGGVSDDRKVGFAR